MAVVGEAHVVIRALTNKVRGDIRRGFTGNEKIGNQAGKSISDAFSKGFGKQNPAASFFGKMSSALQALRPGAKQAYDQFAKLQRKMYTISAAAGAIIGGLIQLGSALGSLVGALGGAAPAFMAVINSMVAFKMAGTVGKMAMKGVGAAASKLISAQNGLAKSTKQIREEMQQLAFDAEEAALAERRAGMSLEEARMNLALVQDLPPNSKVRREAELAYAEADLNLRRAIDRNKDLQDQQKNGPAKNPAADALAGLNKYQKEFARFLASLNKYTEKLRMTVSANLLPSLQKAISTIVTKGFPTLNTGFGVIAKSMGSAAIGISKVLTSAGTLTKIGNIFGGMGRTISMFGKTLGNVLGGFITLMNDSLGITDDFGKFLVKSSGNFKNFLDTKSKSGELKAFFTQAGKLAGMLGAIFGNLGRAFGNFVAVAAGPGSAGEYLLGWIRDVTANWNTMAKGDAAGLNRSLMSGAKAAKAFLQTLGVLAKTIAGSFPAPDLEEFFITIRDAAPYLRAMLIEVGTALPQFGRLVVASMRFLGAFAQTGAVATFFSILAKAAEILADIMESKLVQSIMIAISQLHGFALAFGLLAIFGGKIVDVMAGGLAKVFDQIAQHPILTFLEIVAGMMIYLYQTNEDFAAAVNDAWKSITAAIQPVLDIFDEMVILMGERLAGEVSAAVTAIMPQLLRLVEAVVALAEPIMNMLIPAIDFLARLLTGILGAAIEVIGALVNVLAGSLEALAGAFSGWGAEAGGFGSSLLAMIQSIGQGFATLINAAMPVFTTVISVIGPILQTTVALLSQAMGAFAAFFEHLSGSMFGVFGSFGDLLGGVMEVLGSVVNLVLGLVGPAFGILEQLMWPVITVVQVVLDNFNALITPIMKVVQIIGGQLQTIFAQITPIIGQFATLFANIFSNIGESVIPALMTLVSQVGIIFSQMMPVIVPIIEVILDVVGQLFSLLGGMIQDLAPTFVLLVALIRPVVSIIMGLITPLMALVKAVLPPLMGIITTVADAFVTLANALMPVVTVIIDALVPVINTISDLFIGQFQVVLVSIIGVVQQLVDSILPPFIQMWEMLGPMIANLVSELAPLVSMLLNSLAPVLSTVLVPIIESFGDVWSQLLPIVFNVINMILPIVMNLVTQLVPVIGELAGVIAGIITSMMPVVGQIMSLIMSVMPMIIDLLLPVIMQIIEVLVPLVDYMITALMPIFTIVMKVVGQLAQVIAGLLVPIIGFLVGMFQVLMPVVMFIVELLMVRLIPVVNMLVTVFKFVFDVIMMVVNVLMMILMPVIQVVIGIFALFTGNMELVGDIFKSVWEGIVGFFIGIVNSIIGVFEGLINFIIDGINFITAPIRFIANTMADALGFDFEMQELQHINIPRLAKGGTVMPSRGGSLVNIAEAGKPEKVVPLDSNGLSKGDKAVLDAIKINNGGGSGITINVQGGDGMDVKELAAEVNRRLAFQMRKGSTA